MNATQMTARVAAGAGIVLAAVVAVTMAVSSSGAESTRPLREGSPPEGGYRSQYGSKGLRDGLYRTSSYTDHDNRFVELTQTFSHDGSWGLLGIDDIEDVKIPVAYHPANSHAVGPKELVVCGVTRGGEGIIELWHFGEGSFVVGQTPAGEISYEATFPAVTRIDEIYRGDVFGEGPVISCAPMLGVEDRFICQFWESFDLYQVDYSAESVVLTPLFSAIGTPGAQNLPELGDDLRPTLWSEEHVNLGYVYYLANSFDLSVEPLLFFDLATSMDGEIDTWQVVGPGVWQSLGLHDSALYVRDD